MSAIGAIESEGQIPSILLTISETTMSGSLRDMGTQYKKLGHVAHVLIATIRISWLKQHVIYSGTLEKCYGTGQCQAPFPSFLVLTNCVDSSWTPKIVFVSLVSRYNHPKTGPLKTQNSAGSPLVQRFFLGAAGFLRPNKKKNPSTLGTPRLWWRALASGAAAAAEGAEEGRATGALLVACEMGGEVSFDAPKKKSEGSFHFHSKPRDPNLFREIKDQGEAAGF